jgi:hypothetical protein
MSVWPLVVSSWFKFSRNGHSVGGLVGCYKAGDELESQAPNAITAKKISVILIVLYFTYIVTWWRVLPFRLDIGEAGRRVGRREQL